MKKQYQLTYADGYDMVVEIDDEVFTEERQHEMNNFWLNPEDRLIRCTILEAVLKLLCAEFMSQSVEYMDPESQFNHGQVEGFPPLDGSCGVRLVRFEPFEFESELVDVLELTT